MKEIINNNVDAPRFDDLESKGYVVVPSFLDLNEINFLLNDYLSEEVAKNRNYSVVEISAAAIEKVKAKIEEVIAKVKQLTDINVDISAIHIGYYFASEKVAFDWHQDHESYYALQNHYDYLNFYIPIQKPRREKGNLQVIPWDTLEQQFPEQFKRLVRSGANQGDVIGNKTVFTGNQGLLAELPIDINTISYTPALAAGDLLLLRGDTIHRTQDTETDRIALSLRLTNPDIDLSKQELLTGGKRKTKYMINNWSSFGPMLKAFRLTGQTTMTWRQMQAALSLGGKQPVKLSKGQIIHFRIWLRRIRRGAFFSSIKCWFRSYRAGKYVKILRDKNN